MSIPSEPSSPALALPPLSPPMESPGRRSPPAAAGFHQEILRRLDAMEKRLLALESKMETRASPPAGPVPVASRRRYTPGDLTVDSHTPLTKVLQECDQDDVPLEKAMTMSACRMADVLFSPGTLRRSTLQGRNNTRSLDPAVLGLMMRRLKGQFGARCTDAQFRQYWKKCRQSLSAKCKHSRASAVRTLSFFD